MRAGDEEEGAFAIERRDHASPRGAARCERWRPEMAIAIAALHRPVRRASEAPLPGRLGWRWDREEGGERRGALAGVADPMEIGVEVEYGWHDYPPTRHVRPNACS